MHHLSISTNQSSSTDHLSVSINHSSSTDHLSVLANQILRADHLSVLANQITRTDHLSVSANQIARRVTGRNHQEIKSLAWSWTTRVDESQNSFTSTDTSFERSQIARKRRSELEEEVATRKSRTITYAISRFTRSSRTGC